MEQISVQHELKSYSDMGFRALLWKAVELGGYIRVHARPGRYGRTAVDHIMINKVNRAWHDLMGIKFAWQDLPQGLCILLWKQELSGIVKIEERRRIESSITPWVDTPHGACLPYDHCVFEEFIEGGSLRWNWYERICAKCEEGEEGDEDDDFCWSCKGEGYSDNDLIGALVTDADGKVLEEYSYIE